MFNTRRLYLALLLTLRRCSAHTRLTWLSLHPASLAVRAMLFPPVLSATILSCVAASACRPAYLPLALLDRYPGADAPVDPRSRLERFAERASATSLALTRVQFLLRLARRPRSRSDRQCRGRQAVRLFRGSLQRCNELFGFRQWQTANAIDLFRDHDFARLKVRDQPQQLRPIGPSTRGFFAIDAGDVIPGRPGVVEGTKVG